MKIRCTSCGEMVDVPVDGAEPDVSDVRAIDFIVEELAPRVRAECKADPTHFIGRGHDGNPSASDEPGAAS